MKFKILLLSTFLMLMTGCDSKETISNDTFAEKKPEVQQQAQEPQKLVFNLKTFEGNALDVEIIDQTWYFKGFENKAILLNFFGTWCPPCKAELPQLNKIRAELNNDFEVIALDIGNRDGSVNTPEELAAFVEKYKIKFPVTRGTQNNEIFMGLGGLNPSGSIPFSVLFDKNGKFIKPYIGIISEKQLHEDVMKLIK